MKGNIFPLTLPSYQARRRCYKNVRLKWTLALGTCQPSAFILPCQMEWNDLNAFRSNQYGVIQKCSSEFIVGLEKMSFDQLWSYLVWWSEMISMPSDRTNTSTSFSSLLSFILRSSPFQLLTVKWHTKWNDYENTHYKQQAQNTIKYVITKIQWSGHCFIPYLDNTHIKIQQL